MHVLIYAKQLTSVSCLRINLSRLLSCARAQSTALPLRHVQDCNPRRDISITLKAAAPAL